MQSGFKADTIIDMFYGLVICQKTGLGWVKQQMGVNLKIDHKLIYHVGRHFSEGHSANECLLSRDGVVLNLPHRGWRQNKAKKSGLIV